MNILCKRFIPTDYCWFRDPSGSRILVSDQKTPDEDDIYRLCNKNNNNNKKINTLLNILAHYKNVFERYYGTGIKLGECGLTILNAAHNHSGTWSCHMGATNIAATDTVKEISVRITGKNRKKNNALMLKEFTQLNSLFLFIRMIF